MENQTAPSPVAEIGLQAHLVDENRAFRHGYVTSLSGGSLAVHFTGSERPLLALGRVVKLNLTSAIGMPLPPLPARPYARREVDGARVYRFWFVPPRDFLDGIPDRLRDFFRGRDALRVSPPADQPALAEIREPDGRECLAGQVVDISTNGLRIQAHATSEGKLWQADRVEITLHLPTPTETSEHNEGTAELTLFGVIKGRKLSNAEISYGIRFEEPESPAGARALAAIEAYIDSLLRVSIA